MAATKKTTGCGNCNGTGYRPEFATIADGVCFTCGGTGKGDDDLRTDAERMEAAGLRWLHGTAEGRVILAHMDMEACQKVHKQAIWRGVKVGENEKFTEPIYWERTLPRAIAALTEAGYAEDAAIVAAYWERLEAAIAGYAAECRAEWDAIYGKG